MTGKNNRSLRIILCKALMIAIVFSASNAVYSEQSITEVRAEKLKATRPSGMVVSNGVMYYTDSHKGLYSYNIKTKKH